MTYSRPPSLGGDTGTASVDETVSGTPIGVSTVIAALGLLAHWWSRPVAEEISTWLDAVEIEAEVRRRLSGATEPGVTRLSFGLDEVLVLLDEHERLFIGPGNVPCPPYESYWREDVPVEVRCSLIGPCATDLRRLYGELEIELSTAEGELPDHIAVELEALAYALSFEETYPVARSLFFDHLRHWLPPLCRAVAKEAEQPFYRELGTVTLEWLAYVERYFKTADEPQPSTS
ncbi:MAG TPA: molecular chaperone TorD family protein [Acidimicrobiales bacterium]|nr:molecular chaperone TorD family protein [Acidimicrobiales bacterium]